MTDLERIKKDVVEMDSRANVCWYDTKVLTKAVRLILEELTADRKTEPIISKMEQVDKDINVRSKDEPKTQTETQNSNLTFKTLEYCDICDHKGCKECIANALDEHCIPSQFKKQIEDECAKEYEELGLKKLKELIEADRKTEPKTCSVNGRPYSECSSCEHFKCTADEPQMDDLQDWKDEMWTEAVKTEPQTCSFGLHMDCSLCWKESHCKAIKEAERKEREGE